MLIIKEPASTVLLWLVKTDQNLEWSHIIWLALQCWLLKGPLAPYCHNRSNPAAKILRRRSSKNAGTILPQSWSKFMTEIKSLASYCHNWSNPTTKYNQRRRSNQGLAPYCHNWLNPTTKILRQRSNQKGWHPTVTINQTLQQRSYSRDQQKMLAPYCHNLDQSLWLRSNPGAGTVLLQTNCPPSLTRFSVGEATNAKAGYLSIWLVNNQFNPSTRTDRSRFQPVISGGWGQWIRQEIIGDIR